MNKILVIAAHPDDEVLGMGGTIAKLTKDGNEVNVLIVILMVVLHNIVILLT